MRGCGWGCRSELGWAAAVSGVLGVNANEDRQRGGSGVGEGWAGGGWNGVELGAPSRLRGLTARRGGEKLDICR